MQQYRSSRTSVGGGHYELRLFIAEVKPDDFHEYTLTVINQVDSSTAVFTLVEGKTYSKVHFSELFALFVISPPALREAQAKRAYVLLIF